MKELVLSVKVESNVALEEAARQIEALTVSLPNEGTH